MIIADERKRMLTVPMVSRELLGHLEKIGIAKLADLSGKDAKGLIAAVNQVAGFAVLQGPIVEMALDNLVRAAAE